MEGVIIKNFKKFVEDISTLINGEEYILLEEAEKSRITNGLTRTEANKIISSEKKKIKIIEMDDINNQNSANSILKESLLETIEDSWETCIDELFIKVSEIDWKIAKYYFVLRLLKEHTFKVDDKDICGIKTFKDNKEIIIYNKNTGTYEQDGDLYLSELIENRLKDKAENKQVKEIIESIRRKTYYDREDLDKQPKNIKPVGNGLLNLETYELFEFTPKYIFLNKITIDYVKGSECENFKIFLKQILQKDSDFAAIQEWLGYCLLNDTKYSKALLFYGDGENGKSVLLNVIKQFLGRKNVTSISLQYLETSPFAPSRLFGKTANIFADLPKKALSQTSIFKMVVSGDEISGEKKGKDSFEFIPSAKMMFSCNEIPRTPDRTRGFFRRWIILKFLEHFPEGDKRRDENLFNKLNNKKELEGILYFATEGLKRLIKNKGFTSNMKMHEIEEFWTRSSDSIATFCIDKIREKIGHTEKKYKIYNKYEEYCNSNEYPTEDINIFWKRMKDIAKFTEHQTTEGDNRIRTINGLEVLE